MSSLFTPFELGVNEAKSLSCRGILFISSFTLVGSSSSSNMDGNLIGERPNRRVADRLGRIGDIAVLLYTTGVAIESSLFFPFSEA